MKHRISFCLAFLLLSCASFAANPPALDMTTAQTVLQAMDWQEVNIIAIRQGVDAAGAVAPVYATVYGVGKLHEAHKNIAQTLYSDTELGWHFFEFAQNGAHVWSSNGYQEIKPWATW